MHGIDQLRDAELASATFVRRSGDYYLMVTCFKERQPEPEQPLAIAGIDFNIEAGAQMVLDCGIAIGFDEQPPLRVKKLQKDLARLDRTNQKKAQALSPKPATGADSKRAAERSGDNCSPIDSLSAEKSKNKKGKKTKKPKPVSTKNRKKAQEKIQREHRKATNIKYDFLFRLGTSRCACGAANRCPYPLGEVSSTSPCTGKFAALNQELLCVSGGNPRL